MDNMVLAGTVFDAHEFRGRAFARALKELPLFDDCDFRPLDAWSGESDATRTGVPIAIYNAGSRRLTDADLQKNIGAIRVASPDTPVVVMCDIYGRSDIEAAMAMQLQGVISTNFSQDIMLAVFQMLLAGGKYFPYPNDPDADRSKGYKVLATSSNEIDSKSEIAEEAGFTVHSLTPRQTEVLEHLQQGRSNKVIARELKISEATVKIYVRQLLHKFGAVNRTQIVVNSVAPFSHNFEMNSIA